MTSICFCPLGTMFKQNLASRLLASFASAEEMASPKTLNTIKLDDQQFGSISSFLTEALKDISQDKSQLAPDDYDFDNSIDFLVSNLAFSWMTRKQPRYNYPSGQWIHSHVLPAIGSDILLSIIMSLKVEAVLVKLILVNGDTSELVNLFSDILSYLKRSANSHWCLTVLTNFFNALVENIMNFPLSAKCLISSGLEFEHMTESIIQQIQELYTNHSDTDKDLVVEDILNCFVQFIQTLLFNNCAVCLNMHNPQTVYDHSEANSNWLMEGLNKSEIILDKLFLSKDSNNNSRGFTPFNYFGVTEETSYGLVDSLKVIKNTADASIALIKSSSSPEEKRFYLDALSGCQLDCEEDPENLQALQERLHLCHKQLRIVSENYAAPADQNSPVNPCSISNGNQIKVSNQLVSYWTIQESLLDWELKFISLFSSSDSQSDIVSDLLQTLLTGSVYCSPTLLKALHKAAAEVKTKSAEHNYLNDSLIVITDAIRGLQIQTFVNDINEILPLCSEFCTPGDSVLWLSHQKKIEMIKFSNTMNEILNKIVDTETDITHIVDLGKLCLVCPFDILKEMIKRGCTSVEEGKIVAGVLQKLNSLYELNWLNNNAFIQCIKEYLQHVDPSYEMCASNFIEALLLANILKIPATKNSNEISCTLVRFIEDIIFPSLDTPKDKNSISEHLVLLLLSKFKGRMLELGVRVLVKCMCGTVFLYCRQIVNNCSENPFAPHTQNSPAGKIRDLVWELLHSFSNTLSTQLKENSFARQSTLISVSELVNSCHWKVGIHLYTLLQRFDFPQKITIPECLVQYFKLDPSLLEVFKVEYCPEYSSGSWRAYLELCQISEDIGKFLSDWLNPPRDCLDDFIESLYVVMAMSTEAEWLRVLNVLRYLLPKMCHSVFASLAHNQVTMIYPGTNNVFLITAVVANALFLAFKCKHTAHITTHTTFRAVLMRFVEVISQLIDEVMNSSTAKDQQMLNLSVLFHFTRFINKNVDKADEVISLMIGLVKAILETVDEEDKRYWKSVLPGLS